MSGDSPQHTQQLEADLAAATRDVQILQVAYEKGVPQSRISELAACDSVEAMLSKADDLVAKGPASMDGGTAPSAHPFSDTGGTSPDDSIRRAAGY